MEHRRPSVDSLVEGPHNRYRLASRADDFTIWGLVETLFTGGRGLHGDIPPLHPRLLRDLLSHAPDPEFLGVLAWRRALRADEIAVTFGDRPPGRAEWLLRADEVARAWGWGLLGEDGVVAVVLGPDAPGHLPDAPGV
ncbi:hypothetical protein [Actinokineospora bangkokensis]|uniref:Uncharacterized protein n=1 Tax=Actinokineospora bangkokensis TaxID=1193682 RepID=A0A1Q9LJY9_9PSEU|nr:hypothetical protein [Actinokineospora bangkokensis]OLR92361.1 hypothetical protein BJP25_19920 [Actinokineospora bangkokensis]